MAREELGGERDKDGKTNKHVTGLRSLYRGEEGSAQDDERGEEEDDRPHARNAMPETDSSPKSECDISDIQQEQNDGDGLIDGIVPPGLCERENVAGVRKTLDTRREP